jgi:hypothetical protein
MVLCSPSLIHTIHERKSRGSMTTDLGERVEQAMRRSRALEQQRAAAAVVLAKCGACPTVARWARRVERSDEIGAYALLYRVVERDISCLL